MKYIVDNDLHIHSQISACSCDEKQTNERILEYAKANGLKNICLTDHFWDERVEGVSDWYRHQNFAHISRAKPLPQADGINFLFGCETEMDKYMNLGISDERFNEFDFVVIPTTHLHMMGFTLDESDSTVEGRADLWVKRLEAVLSKNIPFHKVGIAHLATEGLDLASRNSQLDIMNAIKTEDMERLFSKAARLGCGIELNSFDMNFKDEEADTVLRMFKIAKSCGCKFYLGSDAHHPDTFEKAKAIFERAVELLGLTEEDKFHVGVTK